MRDRYSCTPYRVRYSQLHAKMQINGMSGQAPLKPSLSALSTLLRLVQQPAQDKIQCCGDPRSSGKLGSEPLQGVPQIPSNLPRSLPLGFHATCRARANAALLLQLHSTNHSTAEATEKRGNTASHFRTASLTCSPLSPSPPLSAWVSPIQY